jgi:hypothetical protein
MVTNAEERNMTVQESKRGTSSKRRQPVGLGSGLEKWLSAYAAASIAAGVSMLAMTKSAEAKIVYTPADTNIPVNNRESFLLDLNHDGIADFAFWNLSFRSDLGFRLSIGCAPIPFHSTGNCRYQENEIWGKGVASGRFASALRAGFTVGANKSYFQQGRNWRGAPQAQMADFWASIYKGSGTFGQWMYTKQRYLGLQFVIAGQVHYGWARVAVTLPQGSTGIKATLTGYAYETIPNQPIVTGKTKGPDVITLEPASLGRLAQGASGVSCWREKK